MLERLNFDSDYKYSAMEGAIHLTRYIIAKEFCKNKVVLDVACGEGYGSSLMSNWGAEKIIGVDVSQEAIDKANKFFSTDKIQFNCNSAENMEFLESNSFDLIVSLETVEHIGNPDRFLKELKRLIRDDGTIILSCPNDWYYFPDVKEGNQYHMKKYKFNEFFELLVFDSYYFFHVTWILKCKINAFFRYIELKNDSLCNEVDFLCFGKQFFAEKYLSLRPEMKV